jgi:dTDP-4-amino-4,6-dideoxygalactose transaminase
MRSLHAQQMMVRRYFYPGCHKMEPYASLYPRLAHQFPATDGVCERVLILPTGTGVDAADVERVCISLSTLIAPKRALAASGRGL